ncbi:hypothetical protein GQ42DRAFT_160249, partial [Ramicandelaber brevisporus]
DNDDQRQQARGGGESQRKRGRTKREGEQEQMEHAAGKTRMPATPTWRQRDNHHGDRTPRQNTPAPETRREQRQCL